MRLCAAQWEGGRDTIRSQTPQHNIQCPQSMREKLRSKARISAQDFICQLLFKLFHSVMLFYNFNKIL